MAAVSAWAKLGSWALASEEHDAVEKTHQIPPFAASAADEESSDFPSLAAAAVAKVPKKKKAQTFSLADFNSAPLGPSRLPPPYAASKVALTPDALLVLPTGPRERSAEELERASYRGFGLSYGGGARRGDDSGPRRGFERGSDEPRRNGFGGDPGREQGPSRADEVEDWGAGKKSVSVMPDSRDRRSERGFFDSQSRADDSDSWISNKGTTRNDNFDGHRERRMGFDWNGSTGGGGGADAEFWGKKKAEEPSSGADGRRRIVLQPRSLTLDNTDAVQQNQAMGEKKSKSSNPFGNARPREEVLAEKGQDWKEIDIKLENMKIKEETSPEETSLVKNTNKTGTGSSPEVRTERSWRNLVAGEASPPRAVSVEVNN